jgi:Mg/Co/Ni transporter MgtE
VTEYLNLLNDKNRLATYDLLGYPERSVARLVDTNFTTVRKEWTIGQAQDHLRRFYSDTPAANVIFVVDNSGKLVDDFPIRRLVLNEPTKKIEDIMDGFYVKLDIQDSIEDAIQKFKEYDRVAIPVTNSNNVVMGVVTIDDVIDEAEEKDTKEMQMREHQRYELPRLIQNTLPILPHHPKRHHPRHFLSYACHRYRIKGINCHCYSLGSKTTLLSWPRSGFE